MNDKNKDTVIFWMTVLIIITIGLITLYIIDPNPLWAFLIGICTAVITLGHYSLKS